MKRKPSLASFAPTAPVAQRQSDQDHSGKKRMTAVRAARSGLETWAASISRSNLARWYGGSKLPRPGPGRHRVDTGRNIAGGLIIEA